MSLSVFGEKTITPTDEMLVAVLGDSLLFWNEAIVAVRQLDDALSSEWKYYSKAAGWTLVIKSGKRTILYLIPQGGYFKANFVFGDKAVAVAQTGGLPDFIVNAMLSAKKYAEGRSFMVDVKCDVDCESIKKLIQIKVAN